MLKIVKKAAACIAAAVMIVTAASCGEDPVIGNLSDVKKEENANEIYAVISVREYGDITAKLFPGAAPEAVKRFTENAELGYYNGTTIHRIIEDYVIQGGSLNGDGSDGNVPDSLYIPVETSAVTFNFYGALCLAASKKGCYSQFYIVNNNEPQDIDAVIETLSGQLADESFASRLLDEDKKKYQDYLDKLKAIPAEVKEKYKRVGGLYDLDGTSTVMGQVIDGFDVLQAISSVEVVTGNRSDDKAGMPSKPLVDVIIDHVDIVRFEAETTDETTTTNKTVKPKKTSEGEEVVNAETLPTAAESDEDTTMPAEDDEAVSEQDTTSEEQAAENTEAAVTDEPATLPEDQEGETPVEALQTEAVQTEEASADNAEAQTADEGSSEQAAGAEEEEVVVIEG